MAGEQSILTRLSPLANATIIVDASWKQGNMGWAAWIRVDGIPNPIKVSGTAHAPNSNEAEILAAKFAIRYAKKNGATSILLQSDNTNVAQLESNSVKYKHVKGHSSISDARHYCNRWADGQARKARTKCFG